MNASIKTFFAAHKTTIMLASAVLVIGAKSFSSMAVKNTEPQMQNMPPQQMQMQQPNGQMPQGYSQQMPQQNMNNQEEGFFDGWFDGGNEEENYNAYNNASEQGYNGYTGGANNGGGYYNANTGGNYYSGTTGSGYSAAGTGSASYYNPSANQVDYTSGWYKTQASQDAQHERFTDYIRDETKYNDAEGNTYKLTSGYDNNYVNTTNNTYVQTNDASFDPNTYSTSTYTSVTPSDYSSSSSSTSGGE